MLSTILSVISLILFALFCYYAWVDIKHYPKSDRHKNWKMYALSIVLTAIAIVLAFHGQGHGSSLSKIYNMVYISLTLFILALIRVLMHFKETNLGASAAINLADFTANLAVFLCCYTATLKINVIYTTLGVLLAIANISRVLYYRLKMELKAIPTIWIAVINIAPRTYLYAAYSFTIIQLCLFGEGAFKIDNKTSSGDTFVDFMYFNIVTISTVGYGDISPVSKGAKLCCSIEILVSILILAGILHKLLNDSTKKHMQKTGRPSQNPNSDSNAIES